MTKNYMDSDYADKTFNFLKKVLSAGDKETTFQPRGPKEYSDNGWDYKCELKGSIDKFSGHESISHNGKVVFTHAFFGGFVLSD